MKPKTLILYLIIIVTLTSCFDKMKKADLIVHNAKVYTVDSNFTIQQAFAVQDGKFLSVGSDSAILSNFQSENIIDAKGKVIYPGFNDGHSHFTGYGKNIYGYANLVGTKSYEEVIEVLNNHHKNNEGEWLIGRGWDQNDWEVKEFPDKKELDRLFPGNPVVLIRVGGHTVLANSEALKRAGINRETKIEGGFIEKKNGELTGILLENASDAMRNTIPELNNVQKTKALIKAQENCFSVGLTSVTDAGLDKHEVKFIDSLQKAEKLKIRIYAMLIPTEENLKEFVKKGKYKTGKLCVSSIKLYSDGALGSRGAKLIEPYTDDPENSGLLRKTPEHYRNMCEIANENDYQVNTHAIGDSAVRLMLNIYGVFLKSKNDKRWRIEHSQVVNPDDFELFEKYSIIPSVQPTHATSDMYWAEDRLGQERITGAYAYKKLLNQNGWLINGTDFPIEDINPVYTFYSAVVRKDLKGYPEQGFQMENALNREETLKSMTIWPAKGSFEENEKGSIEPGKFADFVILDKDIMQIESSEIPFVKVLSTYLGGEKVYSRE